MKGGKGGGIRSSVDNQDRYIGTPMPSESALSGSGGGSGSYGRLDNEPSLSSSAVANNTMGSPNGNELRAPAARRQKLDLSFVPSDSDLMLGDHCKEIDREMFSAAVHPWLTTAIKYHEISHDDIKRMSLSAGLQAGSHKSVSDASFNSRASVASSTPSRDNMDEKLLSRSGDHGSIMLQTFHQDPASGVSNGVLDYATIHLYEISGFDLIPPEAKEEEEAGCFLFCCFKKKNTATPSPAVGSPNVPNTPPSAGSSAAAHGPMRNVFCELSIVEIQDEKGDGSSLTSEQALKFVKSTQTQATVTQNNTLSPSWKVPGLTGPNGGRKRPKKPIVSFGVSFAQILGACLRVKFVDAETRDVVGWVDFELQRLFEITFGTAMMQHMKPLRITEKMKARLEEIEEEQKALSSPKSHRGPDFESKEKMADEQPGGRLRIRAAVLSDYFLIDMLRGPEEELIFSGLNLVFKMVQFCDLQQLYTASVDLSESSDSGNESGLSMAHPISREEFYHPLSLLLLPQNFQYLFSCVAIIDEHPKYANDHDALSVTRKKIACLLAFIFTAGISRLGAVFSAAFENFGDQLAAFTDLERFEEDVVQSFLDVISQVPLRARLEALTCEDGKLINTLLQLCSYDRMEDVQVKALAMINSLSEQLRDADFWRRELLKRVGDSGIETYLCEQMESWHPKLAEESITLMGLLLDSGSVELSDSIREILRRIEEENLSMRQGKIAQKVLFDMDFRLKKLEMNLVWSTCKSRQIYCLSNVASQDSSDGHTPRGSFRNVGLVFEFKEAPVAVTHVLGCSPIFTSSHAARFITFCLSNAKPSKKDIDDICRLQKSELIEMCRGGPKKDGLMLLPVGFVEFEKDAYLEYALAAPQNATFLTAVINPDDKFYSKSHIELSFVAALGHSSEDKSPRRSHLELVGEAGVHVGIKIPKKPNQNLLTLLSSPEMLKNLPS
eukprot:TRINITY_DN10862_c0_g1_i1.p1 TRINITY_DN10862_c0_g1~~TRINITY_DN10862_c0_g1_i1.p1  ORF type:complete len:952 (+),score=232.73 TRINITY_DN10862_c0_g1_i1:109-2964(+)